MSQAIAWMYLQEKLNDLRIMGMRGAVEIKNIMDALSGADELDRAQAARALPLLADKVGIKTESLIIVFKEIAEDPYSIFLESIWS
jgi:hypothetical protein